MNFLILFVSFLALKLCEADGYRENHLSTLGSRISVLKGTGSPHCPLHDLTLQLVTLVTGTQTGYKTNFDKKSHTRRMIEMQSKEKDVRGHILGETLGGPAKMFNLAPQSFAKIDIEVNGKKRSNTTQWNQIEKEIENYVGEGKGTVNYRVYILYQDEKTPCRPSEFRVYADYYNRTGDFVKSVNSGPLVNNNGLEVADPLLKNAPGPPLPGPKPKPKPKKPSPPKKPKRFNKS